MSDDTSHGSADRQEPASWRFLDPFVLNGVELRNRVVMLPHVTLYAQDGRPSERLARYLVERARGGVGLIISESQSVHRAGGHPSCVDAWDETAVAGWRSPVDAIHGHGARIFAQLSHFGVEASPQHTRRELWAPSAVPIPAVNEIPYAVSAAEMAEVVDGFVISARNLLEVGFDGIEIKIGHDGLLRAFLSPATNHRSDAYGEGESGRFRFPLEVLAAVRAAVGERVPVGVRLCLEEGIPGGYGLAEAIRFAEACVTAGVDYLSADMGTRLRVDLSSPPMSAPHSPLIDAIRSLKQSVDVPVIGYGRIVDPADADAIVRDGVADLVGMARQLLVDPEWVDKVRKGLVEDIRPCVACNQECIGRIATDAPIGCVHNPAGGREAQFGPLRPVATRRVVAVVGGGPAGLKAAEVAAARGHDVVLFEAADQLGGQVRLAAAAPDHVTWGRIVEHLAGRIQRLGVDVKLGTRACAADVMALVPDAVIVATGSQPTQVPFDVDRGVPVLTAWDLLDERAASSGEVPHDKDVMLVDLGVRFEAAAMVEQLVRFGNRVRWVSPALVVGHEIDPGTLTLLRKRLADHEVRFLPTSAVLRADWDAVLMVDTLSQRVAVTPGVDAVVVAGNKRSEGALAADLADRVPRLMTVGDAVAPRNVTMAIHDGEVAGRAV
jgi:2,4-dienoyl-CoA reductase-like NADH-dependent reductase (Old Yellow Enzyme family)